jgi:hypothetical protein
MLVEYQPRTPSIEPWRDDGLHERLAGLQIFAGNGHLATFGHLDKRWNVNAEIRDTVCEWDPCRKSSIGVNH